MHYCGRSVSRKPSSTSRLPRSTSPSRALFAPNLSWSDLQEHLANLPLIHLGHLADEIVTAQPLDLGAHFTPDPRFGGQVKTVLDHLEARLTSPGFTTVVVTRQAARLAELWSEQHSPLASSDSLSDFHAQRPTSNLHFIQGALADGFTLTLPSNVQPLARTSNLQILTDSEIFGWARPEPRRRRAQAKVDTPEASYADFNPGDHVVHLDYGIGKYIGLVKRAIESVEREYLHIQFEGNDDLFVPIIQADRLTKYVGAADSEPSLSRLGTAEWNNTRARAQQAAEEVARELLNLYAQRELAPGRAFGPRYRLAKRT